MGKKELGLKLAEYKWTSVKDWQGGFVSQCEDSPVVKKADLQLHSLGLLPAGKALPC